MGSFCFNRGIATNKGSTGSLDIWVDDNVKPGTPYVLFVLENKNLINNRQIMNLLKQAIVSAGILSYKITVAINRIVEPKEIKSVTSFYLNNTSNWLEKIVNNNKQDEELKAIVCFGQVLNQITKSADLNLDDFLVPYFRSYFYIGDKFVGKYNTHIFPVHSLKEIFPYSDGYLLSDTWVYKHFARVLKIVAKGDYWTPDLSEFNIIDVKTKEEFLNICHNNYETELLSFDLETSGLDFNNDIIKCLTISFDGISGYYIPWEVVDVNELSKLMLSAKNKIAVNGKFDLKFLWKNGLDESVHLDNDIMLMVHCMNSIQHAGLKSSAFLYTPYGGYDNTLDVYKTLNNVKDYSKIPDSILKPYATIDAILPIRIYKEVKSLIDSFDSKYPSEKPIEFLHGEEWNIWKWYKEICMPLENNVSSMEYRGIIIDREFQLKNREYLKKEIIKVKEKLNSIVNRTDINWFSTDQLGKLFKSLGWPSVEPDGSYSSKEESLFKWSQMAKDNKDSIVSLELIDNLQYLRGLKNCLNSFLGEIEVEYDKRTGIRKSRETGWEQYIHYHENDNTWRVHPNYSIMGTETFRMKCHEPNFQNIPSHSIGNKYVKQCIGVPTADLYKIKSDSGKVYYLIETDFVLTKRRGWIQTSKLLKNDIIDESVEENVKTYDEMFPVPGIIPTKYKDIIMEFNH